MVDRDDLKGTRRSLRRGPRIAWNSFARGKTDPARNYNSNKVMPDRFGAGMCQVFNQCRVESA